MFILSHQPKYVLQSGGGAGYSKFYFNKAQKNYSSSAVAKSIFQVGNTAMAAINPNGQQLAYPKTRISRVVGHLAKRVVIKTTDSLKIGKPNTKRPIVKSPSEGNQSKKFYSQFKHFSAPVVVLNLLNNFFSGYVSSIFSTSQDMTNSGEILQNSRY